jgi:hypothetical protein
MPTSWKEMSVANLRDIARSYKNLHSLGNISKQTKATLIETLSKVMEWNDGDIYTKKEHGGKFVGAYDEDDKQVGLTNLKRPQPENKKKEAQPKKAEQPKQKKAEQPKQKKEDDAKKKSVKKAISQAKSASKDAKKIAPPSQREVEERHLLHNITKARNQAVSASKDAKAIAPPSKEQVEKLMLEKQIQSLPPELQNEIFKKLPENLQGKALGKTDEDMGAEFIKKRLPKAQLKTRADVKDFIYELMEVDEEFERDHYEDLTERTNNDFNYEYGNAEGMSERRFQKLFERTDEKIFREKMNEYKTILIDGRKEKASPSVIRTRLIGTFWG